ncbi:MAG: hypothetical protein NT169_04290, partial [Chloroflexi bacterium]|nr:hypothetical protein [Chloroflexota bacterium]
IDSGGTLAGSGACRTQGTLTINNSGAFNAPLEVLSGTTKAVGAFGGAITVAAGATLQAGISSSCGTLTANGNVTVNGVLSNYPSYACTLVFNGATFTNTGSTTVRYLYVQGAASTLTGAGTWNGVYLRIYGPTSMGTVITLGSPVTLTNSYLTVGDDAGADTLNLAGFDLTLNGGSLTVASNGTLAGVSSTVHTLGSLTITSDGIFSPTLVVNSGATAAYGTLHGSVAIASAATLSVAGSSYRGDLTIKGDVTVNGTLSGYYSDSKLYFSGATFTNNGSTTVRYLYVQGAALTLTGAGTWNDVYLYIHGPTAAGTTATLGNHLTLTNGWLIIGNDAGIDTLDLAGFDLTLNGTYLSIASNGILTGNGTCRTQGTTQMYSDGTFNVPLEVQSGTTAATGAFGGPIKVASGATLQAGISSSLTLLTANDDLTVNGMLTNNQTYACTLVFNGATFTNNGAVTVSNVQFGSAAHTLTGTGSFAASNSAAIQSGITLTLGSDHQMGKLTINAGGRLDITGRTLRLSGSGTPLINNAGLANYVFAGSTVVYNGTVAQTVATSQVEYDSLATDNPAGVTLSAAKTIPGTVILSSGAFAVGTNLRLANGATIQRVAGSLSGTPVFGASVNVSYSGTGDVATGAELPTAATVLNDLTINRASTVTLNQDQTVNGALTLTSGTLEVSTRTLTLKGLVASTTGNLTSAAAGTVVYARTSGAQNVGPGAYGNLTLDNPNGATSPAGLTVNGLLRIKQGAFTSASAYHDVQIDGGATLALSGDCTVSGNFTNSGALNANGRTVTFNGSGIQNLTASATTAFASLTVSTGITLVETVAADNATVTGTLSNTGAIRKTRAIAAPGLATFGLTGVQMNVSAQGTLTSLQVDRVDANHPNATVGVRTDRYWDLTPNGGAGGYTVTLTLPHNGLAGPTACRYAGADWDCVRTSFTPTTVTRSGITTLSPWAVGDGIAPPVAPDVILSWTNIPADAEGYVVWYSETPYFLPGDPDAQSVTRPAGSTGWTHTGGGGDPAHNYHYVVQGVNAAGVRSGPSNRAGVFSFTLAPGMP